MTHHRAGCLAAARSRITTRLECLGRCPVNDPNRARGSLERCLAKGTNPTRMLHKRSETNSTSPHGLRRRIAQLAKGAWNPRPGAGAKSSLKGPTGSPSRPSPAWQGATASDRSPGKGAWPPLQDNPGRSQPATRANASTSAPPGQFGPRSDTMRVGAPEAPCPEKRLKY